MEQIYKVLKNYIGDKKKCIICAGQNFSLWAKLYYLQALKCCSCGMVSVNPHINEEGLKIFYSTYFKNRLKNKPLFGARTKMYKLEYRFLKNYIRSGSVLDIGCSGGFFLNEFDPHLWKRRGVDIDINYSLYARKKFGIDVITGDFSKIDFGKEKFNLVILRGVIEHCLDPISYFRKCISLLRPNGKLFITATPNIESFCAEVYREKWRLFTPIEHIHFFSVNLLNKALRPLGLLLLENKYFYDETPYASLKKDYQKLKKDIILIGQKRKKSIGQSPPFWGNMITALWVLK